MKNLNSFLIILLLVHIVSCNNKANKMKEIKRDNAVINYQVTGKGDTTLLFVHGSYIDQEYWKNQVSFFNQKYKVVTLDLPGHGKSGKDRNQWTFNGFAEDVNTIIKELNLKNVILIGHSMGGDINLIAATSNPSPIIGFISIDYFKNAATPPTDEFQKQEDTILQNLKNDFENTNEQYARMALLTPQTSVKISSQVVQDYRNAYKPMGIETTKEIFTSYKTQKELLPLLKLKLYLINVDYLPTDENPLKQYAVNGFEVIHMTGTCHFPMLENPDELNEHLQQTINKISMDNH